MVRLRWVFAAVLLIPLLDALLLVVVAGALGWKLTVALVVLTALLGMLLVRAEGRHAIHRVQRSLAQGDAPTNPLIDGVLVLLAGALLLSPGLVTDSVGLLFLIPPTRYVVRTVLKTFVIGPYLDRRTGGFVSGTVYTFGFPDDAPNAGKQDDAGEYEEWHHDSNRNS